jgi:hypothetical protein
VVLRARSARAPAHSQGLALARRQQAGGCCLGRSAQAVEASPEGSASAKLGHGVRLALGCVSGAHAVQLKDHETVVS